jgi:stearoyl-CoA desaturase (delta-9 desaturase)
MTDCEPSAEANQQPSFDVIAPPADETDSGGHDDIIYPSALAFIGLHVACLAIIWTGVSWQSVALCVALYWFRIFAIGAGYHRYFSHRSFSTNRVFQFVLAFCAQTTAQKSVLWWAAKHRHHHLYSDTVEDVHSPRQTGFFYSHIGWIFSRKTDDTDMSKIADFARYRELMWLHRYELVPAVSLGTACFLLGGWSGLVVGFCLSTVLVYHATFCINSLAHVWGRKRYVTGDDSRNNWLLALFTMGEGWHNNHHAYQSSARQGFRWWEIDPTYYILKLLSFVGIVWGLKTPPLKVVRNEHRLGMRVIDRAATELAARFSFDRIAAAVLPHDMPLETLREALAASKIGVLSGLLKAHLVNFPTREDLLAEARALFAATPSFEEIVDRAYDLIVRSTAMRLAAAS